jgi:hypothetical protein
VYILQCSKNPPGSGKRVAISPKAKTVGHRVIPTKQNASKRGMGPAFERPSPDAMKSPVPMALPRAIN